jgi:hypothetical protein
VAQPRLGRRDQSPGNQGALFPGKYSYDVISTRIPRECCASGGKLINAREIKEGRQDRTPSHLSGHNQLGNLKEGNMSRRGLFQVYVGNGRIGGAEVNPDRISGLPGRGIVHS